jgi:hypothetical protein
MVPPLLQTKSQDNLPKLRNKGWHINAKANFVVYRKTMSTGNYKIDNFVDNVAIGWNLIHA